MSTMLPRTKKGPCACSETGGWGEGADKLNNIWSSKKGEMDPLFLALNEILNTEFNGQIPFLFAFMSTIYFHFHFCWEQKQFIIIHTALNLALIYPTLFLD